MSSKRGGEDPGSEEKERKRRKQGKWGRKREMHFSLQNIPFV
jgi:hypothetical protein